MSTALFALVLYFSPGGNTKKVAEALAKGLERQGSEVTLASLKEGQNKELSGSDLVCLGAPAYNFSVPEPVLRYIKSQLREQGRRGRVRPGSPTTPGKWGGSFVTYAGAPTGSQEAL